MLCRLIVAPLVLIGLSGCALAIEPRLFKPSATSDSSRSEPDSEAVDASLGDSNQGDATTIDATVADAVVTTDAPSRSDADAGVSDSSISGRDVIGDANPPLQPCRNDGDCTTGNLCCARLGRCMPERAISVLCSSSVLDCPRVACGPGQLCCDGVIPARCVSLETYLTTCPNRGCVERFGAPIGCPATGAGGARLECCNNRCVNVATNVNHCGRCGNSCGSGLVCGSGGCETCLHSTVDDPNIVNLRCCRSPADVECALGRPCCAPLPLP